MRPLPEASSALSTVTLMDMVCAPSCAAAVERLAAAGMMSNIMDSNRKNRTCLYIFTSIYMLETLLFWLAGGSSLRHWS